MSFKKFIALLLLLSTIMLCGCVIEGEAPTDTTTVKTTESTTKSETATNQITTTTKKETTTKESTTKSKTTSTTEQSTTKATTKPSTTKASTTKKVTTTKTTTAAKPYCTLTIECKKILSNMDKLKEGHSAFVPRNGYILSSYKCDYKDGCTAYDILKNSCKKNNISLNSRNSVYGIYVVGINNLDEFDCGGQSGWLYTVNGISPSVSCGSKKVNVYDNIVFSYTC